MNPPINIWALIILLGGMVIALIVGLILALRANSGGGE
jgi:hypothetical protein